MRCRGGEIPLREKETLLEFENIVALLFPTMYSYDAPNVSQIYFSPGKIYPQVTIVDENHEKLMNVYFFR